MATTGTQWSNIQSAAAFGIRTGMAGCEHGGYMWVSGGVTTAGANKQDVYRSSDGITWTQITASGGFGARSFHQMLSYNSKLWIMGGDPSSGADGAFNDVWYSTDGITWTQATAAAAWAERSSFGAVVFNSKMWVFGGIRTNFGTTYKNVYHSTDGVTWTLATSTPGWAERCSFGFAVLNSRIYIWGGHPFGAGYTDYRNDCWSTADGTTWRLETSALRPETTDGRISGLDGQSLAYDGKLWYVGGFRLINPGPVQTVREEIWYSYDGRVWTKFTPAPSQGARYAGTLLAYNNLFYLLGGFTDLGITVVDDVYKSDTVATPTGVVVHSALRSPDLHEPKGINTASDGAILVADGAGSGDWVVTPKGGSIPNGGGAGIPADVTLTAPTAYTAMTIAVSGNLVDYGFTMATGPKATYNGAFSTVVDVHFSCTLAQTDATDQDVYVCIAKNGVVLEQFTQLMKMAQNIPHCISGSALVSMTTSDYIQVFAKVAAGNLTISNCYLTCNSLTPSVV